MVEDVFGFGGAKKPPAPTMAEKLKNIVPAADTRAEVALDRVDKIAEQAGFPSREPSQVERPDQPVLLGRRRKVIEQTVAINMRVPLSAAAQFQQFCEENRYSYPAALVELMKRSGLIPQK